MELQLKFLNFVEQFIADIKSFKSIFQPKASFKENLNKPALPCDLCGHLMSLHVVENGDYMINRIKHTMLIQHKVKYVRT